MINIFSYINIEKKYLTFQTFKKKKKKGKFYKYKKNYPIF